MFIFLMELIIDENQGWSKSKVSCTNEVNTWKRVLKRHKLSEWKILHILVKLSNATLYTFDDLNKKTLI